ncbi:MAG TPA: amidase family protein, partial [Mycobacteriales bacterium]
EISPINRGLTKYRMLIPAAVLKHAELVRTLTRRSLAAAFADVDVIAWPTVPAVAPPLEEPMVQLPSGALPADAANPRGAGLANLTGIPAVSLPVGFEDGMPVGLQLQGAWGSDALLLDAAEALERATERRYVDAVSPVAGGAGAPT